VHYWSVPNTGSAESDLHAVPSPNVATSMEYAYMLGLVDRLSAPLLEPFVDGAGPPMFQGSVLESQLEAERSGPEPSFQQLSCRCMRVTATTLAPTHRTLSGTCVLHEAARCSCCFCIFAKSADPVMSGGVDMLKALALAVSAPVFW